MPSSAKFQRRQPENFERPPLRGARVYSTIAVRKPTLANSPFMKRRRCGSARSAATTSRSISRKSPTFSGISTSDSALWTR